MSEMSLHSIIGAAGVSDRPGVPIHGSTARRLTVAPGLHKASPHVVGFRLSDILFNVAGDGWYALVIHSDGKSIFAGAEPDTLPPPAEVMVKMLDVLQEMNKRLHANGHWIAYWHREHRLAFIWRNADGIAVIEYGIAEPWERVKDYENAVFLENAATAMHEAGYLIQEAGLQALYTHLASKFMQTLGKHRLLSDK